MKIQSQKRILREDLKGAPEWITGLIDPINSFMESVYRALTKNITFQDNIACFVREFKVTTDATYPSILASAQFNNTLKTKAIGVQVLQVVDNTYVPAAGPVYVPWVEDNGVITISNVTGLDPSKTYTVRVLVF